ncbi:MAG TPA: YIP1 family protein [Candidatus Dormibacteraeota bacterium]
MSLRADLAGLVLRPFQTLPEIDRRRRLSEGALALGVAVLLPFLLGEISAVAPYRPPAQLGSLPSLTSQGVDIYARWVYQHRFLIPAVGALASLLLWLLAATLIHMGARALKGSGSLSGLIKLVGFVSLLGLTALPFSALETFVRFLPNRAAEASLASLSSVVGLGIFLWQNFLLVGSVQGHYHLPLGRAVTAVLGPIGCLVILGIALLIAAVVAAFLMRPPGSL